MTGECATCGQKRRIAASVAASGELRSRAFGWVTLATTLIVALLSCAQALASTAPRVSVSATSAHKLGYSLTRSKTEAYAVCPPASGHVQCLSIADPLARKTPAGFRAGSAGPLLEGGGEKGGFDPTDLQAAYAIPATGGSSETVAVIEAYGYEYAESDLATYREKYGLPACRHYTGCFHKINEYGHEETEGLKSEGEEELGWSGETALDLDMVSAACPECHILVVEATESTVPDLVAAVHAAEVWREAGTERKVTEISNSYGAPENDTAACPKEGCKEYAYSDPGVPITASTGDHGYDNGGGAPNWPATSPHVIAVGGTTLKKASNARGWSDTVWAGSGSGCSLYEPKPSYQHDTECAMRMDDDVAADANYIESPVSVYNRPDFGGWENVGGTSAAAPLIAAIEAHAASATKNAGPEAFYEDEMQDVTSGSNGRCSHTYLCEAELGYDGPSGWGVPYGSIGDKAEFQAITEAATSVTSTGAKLNGYVNTAGVSTTYHFEYGPTTSYGTSVPVPNANVESGAGWQGVNQTITGLHSLAGTYHYRVVATHGSETVYGEDQTFTTTPWVNQAISAPPEVSPLEAVSCSAATACTSVGSYESESESMFLALIEAWNGTTWETQSTPKPTGATEEVRLDGVACVTSSACTAAGYYKNSSKVKVTLAERWNGTEWKIQTTPNPTGASASSLSATSCVTTAECVAVGSYTNSSGVEVTLAERWNGTEWSVQATPNPTGAKASVLKSISCASASECVAVGYYTNSSEAQVALAERWNGTVWSVQTPPNPTGTRVTLASVSCAGAGACTAVGYSFNSVDQFVTLAERWNGTEWKIQTTLDYPGAELSNRLRGVSCASSTECIAVGGDYAATLSERWNGTEWSIEATPTPNELPGWEGAELGAISCLPSTACTAVGEHVGRAVGPFGYFAPLAERRAVPAPYAEAEQASSVGELGATLNGVVNPEGSATKYYFEYGLEKEKYTHKTEEVSAGSGTSNVEEHKAITGLASGTTYHFRIVVTSAGGTTDGPDVAFSTIGKPSVETKEATAIGMASATLNGAVDPRGLETKYHFEYGPTISYGSKTTEVSAGAGTSNLEESAVVTALSANTTYHFRIVASNSDGTTDGADHTFTTHTPILQPAKGVGAFPVAVTSAGGKTTLTVTTGATVSCTAQTGVGQFTSGREGKLTLKLTGCEASGHSCGTEGVVETKQLKMLLAYTYPLKMTAEGRETGVVLSPASGEVVAEISCYKGLIKYVVKGAVIGVVSPLKSRVKTFSLAFKQQAGLQEPAEYETEAGGHVGAGLTCAENGGTANKCGESQTTPTLTLTSEEATIEA
jgi:hypothetical protein